MNSLIKVFDKNGVIKNGAYELNLESNFEYIQSVYAVTQLQKK